MKKIQFGTKEWSQFSENLNRKGCKNLCCYCYASGMAIRFGRCEKGNWGEEVINEEKLGRKRYPKREGVIMFPTTHDITSSNVEQCISYLQLILAAGNQVLIVTKADFEVVQKLCEELREYQDQLEIRVTIGSTSSTVLKFWEPEASTFMERKEALELAFNEGYVTSVSAEPLLDNDAEELIEILLPFVTNTIWLGKPNKLVQRLKINGYGDEEHLNAAKLLMDSLSDDYILGLYEKYQDNPQIEWKESIKKVLIKHKLL